MAGGNKKDSRPIIIRREEVVEGGHHGGAWKVAYADFVTAMMAFFLLMWLLNATTEDQRRGLADYFSPSNLFSHANSGNGAPFGGRTPYTNGEMASDRGSTDIINGQTPPQLDVDEDDSDTPATSRVYHRDGVAEPTKALRDRGDRRHATPTKPGGEPGGATGDTSGDAAKSGVARTAMAAQPGGRNAAGAEQPGAVTAEQAAQEQAKQERAAFTQAARQIRDAVAADPALAGLAPQLAIDMTPEGLRVQIMDEEQLPMFATGSATLNERARDLLLKVAPVLMKLSESIAIDGHTDSTPYHGNDRTNWELSTERANATRRLLVDAGLPEARIRSVTGHADRDPLLPADRTAAANRRIAIVVLRNAGPTTPAAAPGAAAGPAPGAASGAAPAAAKGAVVGSPGAAP
jgi:chemotaxis protein MotB